MDSLLLQRILSVIFTLTGLTKGAGVLQDSRLHASVGGNVIFTTLIPPETPLIIVIWDFVNISDVSIGIITSHTLNVTNPEYESRITLLDPPGSLELRNLSLNDSGEYRISIIPTGELHQSGHCKLEVLVPVSSVVVTPISTDLLEFNSSVSLSCSSFGSSLSFLWLNGSSEVIASERVQITDGGSNLTIINVTRYDQGPFRCHVFNLVSNGSSNAVNLFISFGPDNIKLMVSPSQEYHENGSDVSLSCSAASRPSALFHWFVNETLLPDGAEPELRLNNIQMSQTGNYSCQAHNSKTLRYQTSLPALVRVLERISGAFISTSSNHPVEGNSFNLTCDAGGSVFGREWMKNGSPLLQDESVTIHDMGRVLSFHTLEKRHNGDYSCNISNPINSEEVEYDMVVNYGPESVKIIGPSKIEVDGTLKLTCSAESTPSAHYTWTLNGTEIFHSAVLTKNATTYSDSGAYICQAMNNVTGRTSASVVHTLYVEDIPEIPAGGLTAGGIAGITVLCLAVVAGGFVGGAMYFRYTKKKLQQKSSNENRSNTTDDSRDNPAYTGNEDLNYANITDFPMRGSGTVQPGLQDSSSQYAQVRVNRNATATTSPPPYDIHMQPMKRPAPQPNANGPPIYAEVRKH